MAARIQTAEQAGYPSAQSTTNQTDARTVIIRVGFWSALVTGVLALLWTLAFGVELIGAPPAPWSGIEAYARTFGFPRMLNLIPALPLGWAYIVMMVSLYSYAPAEKKIWGLIALAFGIVYAVMANINYLIQLIAVRPALLSGELEGLTIFVGDNPHSVFWALANAYAIQSMSLFFAAWIFDRSKLERWIRWLFIVVGLTVPFQFAYSFGLIPMTLAMPVLLIWIVGVPVGCFLLAALFRQNERGAA
ncbi:MAG: hypothetical protein HY741_18515 [Chloroflexi bacterium]|nr:hypothetical protein [Chloroflexota bacterium]